MPPLTYTGSDGVFAHLGALIGRIDSYRPLGLTTLPADAQALLTAFGTTLAGWLPEEGIAGTYEGLRDSVAGWRQALAAYCDRRLSDPATVTTPMGLPYGAGPDEVVAALWRQMTQDSKAVKACLCEAAAPAAVAGSAGTGRAYATLTMDGYSPPLADGPASLSYDGVRSQLCVPSETMTLECVDDSVAGAEAWSWRGGPDYGPLDVRPEGSGDGPGLATCDGGDNLVANGGFESWGPLLPTGWTTPYTPVVVPPTQSAAAMRGASSLQLLAGNVPAYLILRQAVTLGPRRRYFLGLAVRGGPYPGCTVELSVDGAAGALSVDGAALTPSWQAFGAFCSTGAAAVAGRSVQLAVYGLPANGLVGIDCVALSPVTWHGGVGVVVQSGPVAWQRGDRVTFGVTNDGAGKFQSFFRRHYRAQLPSVASGSSQGTALSLPLLLLSSQSSEPIPDTLAN